MNIKLANDLAIFDLEATGLNVIHDRIVEIAVLKVSPEGGKSEFKARVNPEVKIPQEVIEIHGITDADVKDEKTFKELLPELLEFLGDADFAGYNSNKFDLPLLAEEILRAGADIDLSNRKHIDVQNIFHKMEQRTLVAAYKFYCDEELKNAHSAMADATATWEVLDAQVSKYGLQADVNYLADFSKHGDLTRVDFAGRLALNKEGITVYNFGKHKGKSVEQILNDEPGYYGWMLNADFPLFTKQCLKKEVERVKSSRNNSNSTIEAKLDALKNKFNKG